MAKKSTAQKIRDYIAAHPEATANEVAKKCGTTTYVYVTKANDKMANKKKEGWKTVAVATSNEPVNKPANKVTPATESTDVDATLAERGKKYGTFTGHAEVTYKLKTILRQHAQRQGKSFAFDQAEAMDMICHKLGRIVNGDPDYADSWIDIAGYAKLVADRLETGKEV